MSNPNPLAEDLEHIFSRTHHLWDEVRGQRLFITGGTGFFGCWLLESFAWANDKLKLGATAVVLTRHPDAFRKKAPHLADHPAIQLYQGDVRSFEFPPGSFPLIIHAATESSVPLLVDNPLLMFDTIVQGTHHTLEFARQCGTQKFLFTSSGAVYGKQPANLTHIPEEYGGAPDPARPESAYGESKRAAELLCVSYAKQFGIQTKIARCFAFVGPYLPLDLHFAIGNFIRDGLRGGPIEVKGDGTPYRSYLYAADLAIWLWTILLRGVVGRPYNVGSEADLTIKDLAYTVSQICRPSVEVRMTKQVSPGQSPERYVPATRRSQAELQLKQTIGLNESIGRTIAWHSG